jgi:hypothetical protein
LKSPAWLSAQLLLLLKLWLCPPYADQLYSFWQQLAF